MSATVYPFGGSAPYEQLAVDRALPDIIVDRMQFAAAAGETRSDAVNGAEAQLAESPFAQQHNFIAPAP